MTGEVNWLFPAPSQKRYEEKGFGTLSGKVELVPRLSDKGVVHVDVQSGSLQR
jgi:hypothetical protein